MASKASAAVPIRDKAFLTSVFESTDRDRTGLINGSELQRALANGTWKPFGEDLVLLMVKIFDRDSSGKINFEQFSTLWAYITDWVNSFKNANAAGRTLQQKDALLLRVDRTNSGRLDKTDLQTVFSNMGHQLSVGVCNMMIRRFDQLGDNKIMMEDFVRMCVVLKIAQDEYKKIDPEDTGCVKLTYDDFLCITFGLWK